MGIGKGVTKVQICYAQLMKTILIPLLFCLFDGNVIPVVLTSKNVKTTGFAIKGEASQLSFVRTDVRHGQR